MVRKAEKCNLGCVEISVSRSSPNTLMDQEAEEPGWEEAEMTLEGFF